MKIEVEGYTIEPSHTDEGLRVVHPNGYTANPFYYKIKRPYEVIQHLQDKWYGQTPDIYEVAKEIEKFLAKPKWVEASRTYATFYSGGVTVIPMYKQYLKFDGTKWSVIEDEFNVNG